ncbi:hypothetical protein DAI22_03g148600 [Oryza sativa Japonica Group]|nr:hypothetical protein DAI22_03g148600 [Oryza sativa Japonica Group]
MGSHGMYLRSKLTARNSGHKLENQFSVKASSCMRPPPNCLSQLLSRSGSLEKSRSLSCQGSIGKEHLTVTLTAGNHHQEERISFFVSS